jgi:hypothetical protein
MVSSPIPDTSFAQYSELNIGQTAQKITTYPQTGKIAL